MLSPLVKAKLVVALTSELEHATNMVRALEARGTKYSMDIKHWKKVRDNAKEELDKLK